MTRSIFYTLGVLVLSLSSVRAEQPAAKSFEVQSIFDVAYRDLHEGEDAAKSKNKLDLFVPKGLKNFPVVMFIHGGAWIHGDKSSFLRVYGAFGVALAKQGVGTVVINYRLSPAVKHPEHIRDVAQAFAWTHKHIAEYGGNPAQLFVCGHSAGGHLAALLATDETYLKAEGLTLHDVRGVIPISGVYKIPEVGGAFVSIFGDDNKVRKEASPLNHARSDAPPFLIVYADNDLKLCGKECSEEFCQALKDKKCQAQSLQVTQRNHATVFFKACLTDDVMMQALMEFIAKQTKRTN